MLLRTVVRDAVLRYRVKAALEGRDTSQRARVSSRRRGEEKGEGGSCAENRDVLDCRLFQVLLLLTARKLTRIYKDFLVAKIAEKERERELYAMRSTMHQSLATGDRRR